MNLHVAERTNHRVSRWRADGTARGWIGGGERGWQTGKGAKKGWDFDEFAGPVALVVDEHGTIYVADQAADRVSRWSPKGNPLGWLGGGENRWHRRRAKTASDEDGAFSVEGGPGPRRLAGPHGLALCDSGYLYVSDLGNKRISAWRLGGGSPAAAGWIGHGSTEWRLDSAPEETSVGPGTVFWPVGVARSADGDIIVVDADRNQVVRWSPAVPSGDG